MTKEMFWQTIRNRIEVEKAWGAWAKGVKGYASEIMDTMQEGAEYEGIDPRDLTEKKALDLALNGARDWNQYSWGGCSLCYDGDICDALCSPSMQKRYKHGELPPNRDEAWLDVQARALQNAWRIVRLTVALVRYEYMTNGEVE